MSNARFSILQARAVKDKRIGDAQFRTLAALGMYADADGWCFPSLATLGKDLSKSKQAVGRDVIALRKLGYLEINARYNDNGGRRSSMYRLRFDLPPRQPGVDGCQPQVDAPSTKLVDAPSTSEVDVNDPMNDPTERKKKEEEATSSVFTVYEHEIGIITPVIADALEEAESIHGPQWVCEALKIASKNGQRRWSYANAILERWKDDGYGTEKGQGKPAQKQNPSRGNSRYTDNVFADFIGGEQ